MSAHAPTAPALDAARLQRQLDFIVEVDKVKHIVRQSKLFDGSRFENDAEHSWTICLMAMLFAEYANVPVRIDRVVLMLLIHDVVEIDAGDTFLYSAQRPDAVHQERAAAERIFGLLPDDQRDWLIDAWHEYEARETPEAQFAAVFDRLQPVYQNYKTEGFTWKQHGVTKSMVLARNAHIQQGSALLWGFFNRLIEECVAKGYLADA